MWKWREINIVFEKFWCLIIIFYHFLSSLNGMLVHRRATQLFWEVGGNPRSHRENLHADNNQILELKP